MLEVKQKNLNASMFGFPDQDLILSFATSPNLEKGYTGLVSTRLLGDVFTGEMGTTLGVGQACIGIAIENPVLKVNDADVQKLSEAGINLTGAYNMATFSVYNELAEAVGRALFKDRGGIDPTLKIHFGECGENGCKPDQRSAKKIEIIMNGTPTGHPLWTLENF